jgi:solute carrier family 25 (mitochondrial citrate transporter), member 1
VGCSSLVTGNTLKAAIRFLSFDTFKDLLSDENGHISGPRTVLAGLGAGVCESIFAVTPFESIKTSLIDDKKRAVPQYRGLIHGAGRIISERGIRGIYQGLMPTLARQAANSGVRFWSYSTIKQAVQGSLAPGEKLSSLSTFGIGAAAGFITVYHD